MQSILIISLISLVIFLILLGNLIKDTVRLAGKHIAGVFANHSTVFYAELCVSVIVVIVAALCAGAAELAVSAIIAEVFSDDITQFCINLRGVFSLYTEAQNPGSHIGWFFLSPFVKLLATYILLKTICGFFSAMNKRYGSEIYTESDMFLFGFVGAIILCSLQIVFHVQKINGLNMTANLVYSMLSNFSYILYFLAIYWIRTYKSNTALLEASIEKYIVTNHIERKVMSEPWIMLSLSYVLCLLLGTPNYLGLQWLRNDISLLGISLMVMAIVFLILKKFIAQGWNYLSTILFDTNKDISLIEPTNDIHLQQRSREIIIGIALATLALFTIFKAKYMFMFILITLFVEITILVTLAFAYFIMIFVGSLISSIRKKDTDLVSWHSITDYFKSICLSFSKSAIQPMCIILFTFMIITVFPKRLDCSRIYNNNTCVVDTNGDVLWLDDEHDFYYSPLNYDEIPDFVKKCIITQEDRGFFRQNSWLPNKSNWHGISLATIFKGRGGSNLNSQIIKNLTYIDASGFPRDIARKITDMAGGYMLSLTETPEQIITDYVNVACFHSGKGYRGINAAALYGFGKSVERLNKLEQMYLIRTLPNSSSECDSAKTKKKVLDIAKTWKNKRLISKRDYNEISNCEIRFVNKPYKSGISVGTRTFLQKNFTESKRYDTYITLKNEDALNRAYNSLKSSRVFYKNGSELHVSALVVNVTTGHIIGHYSSGLVDYNNFGDGFCIGSLGKPSIILEMLRKGASPNLTLFDGKVKKRKTPANATHAWKNRPVSIKTMLSESLNAPFVNICDIMSPKPVFEGVEAAYNAIDDTIIARFDLCSDTYNYPLGSTRQLTPFQISEIYQAIINDGVRIKLQYEVCSDTTNLTKRIWATKDIAVVKDALSETIKTGTMKDYYNELPKHKTLYSKTGTSSGKPGWRGGKDGWCVLSDGSTLIICWASYGKLNGNSIQLGTEPLFGSSTAGRFAVSIYKEFSKH